MVWSSVNLISWQFGAHKQRGKLCSSLYVNRRRPLINLWSTFGETIILYSSQILYLMNNLFLRDFNESLKALLKRKIGFIILIWFSISVHVTLYIYTSMKFLIKIFRLPLSWLRVKIWYACWRTIMKI
jgi:hypothetical protein